MNNEFKKINNHKETRYVLEDGGSTTSGSIATVEKPLGELQRRAEVPKQRNFVAKNAKTSGAGPHKDKKKAAKQGDVKHKKKAADMSEDSHPDEKEDKILIRKMVKRDALKKEGYGANGYATAIGSAIQPGNGPDVSEDDAGEEVGMAGSELYSIAKHAKELLVLINQHGSEHGLEAWQQSKITKAADYLTAVLQSMDYKNNQDLAEDAYMMELATKLSEKIPKGASVDYYIKDFAKSTAPQFKNKNPAKRKQMAVAAWYDSKRKK
jgi:hypothetical protein